MNRQQAVKAVASWAAGNLQSMSFEEIAEQCGQEIKTDADYDRFGWAVEEVTRRLHRIGGQS